MKQLPNICCAMAATTQESGVHSVKWSLLAGTKGLAPVWISSKVYDEVAASFIRAARGECRKQLLAARLAPLRIDPKPVRGSSGNAKFSANEADSCGYVVKWSLLNSIKGLTQVWISAKAYDAAAAKFIGGVEGKYAKNLLQARMAPLGLDVKCQGSCYGGWCREITIFDGGSSKVMVCECSYYV